MVIYRLRESDKRAIRKREKNWPRKKQKMKRRSQKPVVPKIEEGAKQHETDVALQLDPFSSFGFAGTLDSEPKRAETENRDSENTGEGKRDDEKSFARERERKRDGKRRGEEEERGHLLYTKHVVRLGSVSEKNF